MSASFNAIVAEEVDGKTVAQFKSMDLVDLPDEPVLVDVAYSTINYKDGLAVSGAAPICRRLPLICGIDLAGTVVESSDSAYRPGDQVLVNGYGLSEVHNGGYSQKQRIRPEWIVRIPDGMSAYETMALGTAGYTSMLCVQGLQDLGVKPEDGPVLVTGAAGGVGTVAVSLLAGLGYEVHASTGRVDEQGEFLRGLGAAALVPRQELARDCKPLEQELWAGVVDTVGDKVLATAIAQTKYEGVVTACGLAGGAGLASSVMPFILRGVTLRGIDSVQASQQRRQRAWDALAATMNREHLASLSKTVAMSEVPALAAKILAGEVAGRLVVDVNR
ncbi:oxidoreductase [Seongchinamella unica]|uniref:Oxidoreductase n=1 Tax=Seongchinamella unica TaxID=2547392 RepID=A0A4R5LQH2_9GAMM|nr:MDR family oxidoreductase [Seongchinamella unica]TDG12656.1 oxidoreductase [Seongchinamella unica]